MSSITNMVSLFKNLTMFPNILHFCFFLSYTQQDNRLHHCIKAKQVKLSDAINLAQASTSKKNMTTKLIRKWKTSEGKQSTKLEYTSHLIKNIRKVSIFVNRSNTMYTYDVPIILPLEANKRWHLRKIRTPKNIKHVN